MSDFVSDVYVGIYYKHVMVLFRKRTHYQFLESIVGFEHIFVAHSDAQLPVSTLDDNLFQEDIFQGWISSLCHWICNDENMLINTHMIDTK